MARVNAMAEGKVKKLGTLAKRKNIAKVVEKKLMEKDMEKKGFL